jgi:serine/threonine protein kinase
MELVDGDSIGQRIDRDGKMTEEEAKRIIVQVCQGLHRAHKHNLIHRDIKPDNILLTQDGVAKITDLGLVKGLGEEEMNLTRTGRGLGTPHFMAPEQFRDAKNADIRCDVYSVGATLYMMVTGEMPFDGSGPLDCWMKKIRNEFKPPKEISPELSDRMNWAILRAMSADPDKRPANCREFVEDLLGHSTRPATATGGSNADGDIWYLVYKDEEGQPHTVKGTTDGIRRAIKDNLLGDAENIQGSKTKGGPFTPLNTYPEFRDLLIAAAPLPSRTGQTSARSGKPGEGKTPVSARVSAQSSGVQPQRTGETSRPYAAPAMTSYPTHEAPAEYNGPDLPHIQIQTRDSNPYEYLIWGLISALAGVIGVAVYLRFFK